MSAASFLEAASVIDNRGDPVAVRELARFMRRVGMLIEPFTLSQAQIAREAYRDFGKGRHPAGLDFGDCLSYALAQDVAEPLLFKGTDFARTDIQVWPA